MMSRARSDQPRSESTVDDGKDHGRAGVPLEDADRARARVDHMTQPTIGNAASLHLCSTIPPSSRPHEYAGPRADLDRLFVDPWELRDGTMSIPDRPGLGLTLDPRALESARES